MHLNINIFVSIINILIIERENFIKLYDSLKLEHVIFLFSIAAKLPFLWLIIFWKAE